MTSSPGAQLLPVTYDTLGRIHRRAAETTFWELDPLSDSYTGTRSEVDKGAWLVARALRQGVVGYSIVEAGSYTEVGAFATALFCPAADAPGAVRLPTAPVSPDAWLLSSLHIDSGVRHRGWEAVLIDAVIMAASERQAHALEVFGLHHDATPVSALCTALVRHAAIIGVVEVPILLSAGFEIVRDHPVFPRLRLELPPTHDLLSAAEVADLLAEIPVGGR